jgi:hypothetical protein
MPLWQRGEFLVVFASADVPRNQIILQQKDRNPRIEGCGRKETEPFLEFGLGLGQSPGAIAIFVTAFALKLVDALVAFEDIAALADGAFGFQAGMKGHDLSPFTSIARI